MADYLTMPINELARVALRSSHLVPATRVQELREYRSSLQKPAVAPQTGQMDADLCRQQQALSSTPTPSMRDYTVLKGPRGGRYMMETTRDGRPYRRYF